MENLIEELTKVNPANLSEEGLKLFNKIMEIIDRNEELEKNNKKYKIQLTDNQYIKIIDSVEADVNKKWESKVEEIIQEYRTKRKPYFDNNDIRMKFLNDEKEATVTSEELDINDISMQLYGAIMFGEQLLQEGDK